MARARRARHARAPRADFITVRVGQLPGRIEEIALNGGRTVGAAIEGAGLDAEGYQIKLNSEDAGLEDAVKAGDTILLVRKVSGAK